MGLEIKDPSGDNSSPDSPYRRVGDISPGWGHVTDATPHSPEDSSGGTGQISFSASQRDGESDLLIARDIIADGEVGKINSLTLQNGRITSITTDTILSRLDVERTAQPWPQDLDAGRMELPRGLAVSYAGVPHILGEVVLSTKAAARDDDYIYVYVESLDTSALTRWFVLRYTQTGTFVNAWPQDGGTSTTGGTLTGAIAARGGYVYLTNRNSGTGNYVKKYTSAGVFVSEFRPGTSGGSVAIGSSIAVDSSGNIYVTGTVSGSIIQKFTNAGTFVVAMGTAGSAGNTTFNGEPYITYDGVGIVTSDRLNRRVREYTTGLVFFGELASWSAGSRAPDAITYNGDGIVYVRTQETLGNTRLYSFENHALRRIIESESLSAFVVDPSSRIWGFNSSFDGAVLHAHMWLAFDASGPTSLSAYIHYYICLCLDVDKFEYEYQATEIPDLLFPGWTDSVWEKLKQLAPVKRVMFETTQTSLPQGGYLPRVVVKDIDDGSPPIAYDQSSEGSPVLSLSTNNITRNYSIVAQRPQYADLSQDTVVYSLNRSGSNLTVAEYNTTVANVSVPHSLISVQSPPEHDPFSFEWNDGVPGYMIYDSDDVLVPWGLFAQYGGQVEASLAGEGIIQIRFVGPAGLIPGHSGPFSFTDIFGVAHLSIGGAGVLIDPREINMYTGADQGLVTRDRGPRVDSPFIDTVEQAYDAGIWSTFELSGPRITMAFNTGPGGLIYNNGVPTLITPGMRVSYNHQNWRVMTVTNSGAGSSISLQPYTTVGDVDAIWSGQTVGDYDSFWDGYRTYDAKMRPLWQ